MATTPKSILNEQLLNVNKIKDFEDFRKFLLRLTEQLRRTHEMTRNDIIALEQKFTGAVSGYVDDGVNFRLTITNGIITAIGDSSGAGHS